MKFFLKLLKWFAILIVLYFTIVILDYMDIFTEIKELFK
ncbi:MAG: hypothetical protein K0S51_2620 [Bacillales bacterium]|jgi:hypothetical protein|nr:hypothetical protein [Bacillales bacterium]